MSKFKIVYFIGCVLLFIGLLWLFLPHVAHSNISEEISQSDESDEGNHFENIIYGLISTLTGLSLLGASGRFEEEKKGLNKSLLAYTIGILFISSGVIHASVIQHHFEEWIGYGIFFIVVALLQIIYGFILIRSEKRDKLSERYYFAGIVLQLALIAVYVVSRTVGIPFIGPEAGNVESVAPVDILAKLIEIVSVVLLALLIKKINK